MKRIVAAPEVRFWRRVDMSAGLFGCWLWTAGLTSKGYGSFAGPNRRPMLAYRFAYETRVGPVPDGLELDHTCRNKACVNPAHLEPVTHLENVRRGDSGRYLRDRTHCPRGHSYSGTNLIIRPDGARHCRICRRAQSAASCRRRAYLAGVGA